MHSAMRSLSTHRNTLAPISRLPSELMLHIFWLCGGEEKPFRYEYVSGLRLGWIRVTHVCRYWRDSALQHSSLWSEPTLALGPEWLRLMLSRSKTAPLSIDFFFYMEFDSSQTGIYDMITEHISHIRHFSVGGTVSELMPIFERLASPTDCLESLKVSTVLNHAEQFILPDELRDVFPQLRRIDLQEVPIHWSTPILCGLTHLRLAFDDSGYNSDWWFSKSQSSGTTTFYGLFFSALERMPALEVLDLKNALPSRDGGPHEDRIVALSLLRKLELEDETAQCFDILKQLKFPPSCRLTLICNGPTGVERIADIFPVLRDHARDGDMPPPAILTLAVERDYFQLDIERNHDLLAHAPDFDFSETTAEISLRIPYPEDLTVDRAVAFQALCEVFPLEHLRVFSLRHRYDVDFQWSRERWIEIFGRCRAVEHVHITRTAATLISALAYPIPRSAAEQDAQQGPGYRLFLENLKTLTFRDVNFENEFRNGHEPETLGEVAVKLFASRKQIKGLPTMRVSADCNIATAVREELEKMFEVVRLPRLQYGEWDGISSSDSDDSFPIYSHGGSSADSPSD